MNQLFCVWNILGYKLSGFQRENFVCQVITWWRNWARAYCIHA